jgi:prolyl-tRNA editing enzyme YbaK/EbsC (Cys-tRNA(Pro) deacylase)
MTPAAVELTERGTPHREFTHQGPVASLEQAAAERGQAPEQVVRSILFHITEGEYVLVLIGGPRRIDWGTLRGHLGISRMRMATPDEVLDVTGFQIGSVGPFGLPRPIRTLVDRHLFDQAEVSIGSGVRGTTIFITTENLRKALGQAEEIEL